MEWYVSTALLARDRPSHAHGCRRFKWFSKLDGDHSMVFGEEDAHAASAESLGIGKGVRRALTSKASLSRCQCLVQCNAPHGLAPASTVSRVCSA